MKVKDLIAELKSYNPQARVIVNNGDRDCDGELECDYVRWVNWLYEADGETNKNLVKLN